MRTESTALAGAFTVMPLEELLQWLDQSARTGLVTVLRPDGYETWIFVRERTVVAASAAVLEGSLSGGDEAERAATALECVLDLFLVGRAHFRFEPQPSPPAGGIALDQPLGFVLMEALRQLDEWPHLDQTYGDESAQLRRAGEGESGAPIGAAILRSAEATLSLGEARLRLGLSRPSMLRRVNELVQRGLVTVDGASTGADPVAAMLVSAATLLGEGQYAEASHVFRSLLASDPLDSRARQLLVRAERLEVQALSTALPPDALVTRTKTAAVTGNAARVLELISGASSASASLENGSPVVYVVAASPLREVETLRTLAQLAKTGHVRIEARARESRTGKAASR